MDVAELLSPQPARTPVTTRRDHASSREGTDASEYDSALRRTIDSEKPSRPARQASAGRSEPKEVTESAESPSVDTKPSAPPTGGESDQPVETDRTEAESSVAAAPAATPEPESAAPENAGTEIVGLATPDLEDLPLDVNATGTPTIEPPEGKTPAQSPVAITPVAEASDGTTARGHDGTSESPSVEPTGRAATPNGTAVEGAPPATLRALDDSGATKTRGANGSEKVRPDSATVPRDDAGSDEAPARVPRSLVESRADATPAADSVPVAPISESPGDGANEQSERDFVAASKVTRPDVAPSTPAVSEGGRTTNDAPSQSPRSDARTLSPVPPTSNPGNDDAHPPVPDAVPRVTGKLRGGDEAESPSGRPTTAARTTTATGVTPDLLTAATSDSPSSLHASETKTGEPLAVAGPDSRVDEAGPIRTATAERFENVKRMANAIDRAAATGPRQLRIRLNPPELGALQVEIRHQNGGVVARLQVDNAAAHRTVLDQLPALSDQLSSRGHRVERIDVQLVEGDERIRDERSGRAERETDRREESSRRERRNAREEGRQRQRDGRHTGSEDDPADEDVDGRT